MVILRDFPYTSTVHFLGWCHIMAPVQITEIFWAFTLGAFQLLSP